jgi:hypothetical protein
MKSIARKEFTATNGNVLRFDLSPDGDLKVSILKGKHFQGVAQIISDDVSNGLVQFILADLTSQISK